MGFSAKMQSSCKCERSAMQKNDNYAFSPLNHTCTNTSAYWNTYSKTTAQSDNNIYRMETCFWTYMFHLQKKEEIWYGYPLHHKPETPTN